MNTKLAGAIAALPTVWGVIASAIFCPSVSEPNLLLWYLTAWCPIAGAVSRSSSAAIYKILTDGEK